MLSFRFALQPARSYYTMSANAKSVFSSTASRLVGPSCRANSQDPRQYQSIFNSVASKKTRAANKPVLQAHVIPHPEKAGNCEDAHFFCEDTHFFGVADGVGVWSELGINSAIYSSALLNNIQGYVQQKEESTLYEALLYGYTENLKAKTEGSSTVVLGKMVGREFHALNLGDSGFAIFRNDEMIYKSEEQSHSFNYPFQLGTGGDQPSKAHCIQCTMKRGDLIVMASDGLFDNLFTDEIEDVLKASDPDKIATNLAVSAMAAACSNQKETPFSERVGEETDQIWRGGKMDDITVVVYRVQ